MPLNKEQVHAVATMCRCAAGRKPLALFGPPGTGKTVTLVEMALQVCRRNASLFVHGKMHVGRHASTHTMLMYCQTRPVSVGHHCWEES